MTERKYSGKPRPPMVGELATAAQDMDVADELRVLGAHRVVSLFVETSNGASPKRDFDLAQLREWAGANDVTVPSRGRIPQAIVEQYKAAGGR